MMMGCEPASRLGLVIGNVKNLILHNVSIEPAFKEFTAMTLDREKRPTIRERLAQAQEQTKTKHREREKVKAKDREVAR